jgi:acetyl esterase/lipase
LVAATIWGAVRYAGEISFMLRLYRVSREARAFRAEYAHLARDLVYDLASAARLDVYPPDGGLDHPVLVFFHGGGWYQYDKLVYAPVAMRLLPHNLVVVMVDYTLYPDATVPRMAQECAAAVAWTLEHVAEYGGDPTRVVVAGQSAGAHLAALITTDARYLAATGHAPSEIAGLVGISGVYDVAAEAAFLRDRRQSPLIMERVMEGPQNYVALSPLTYVRANLPPVLLIHGEADTTVPYEISAAFHRALLGAGVQSELVVYPEQGHATMLFWALDDAEQALVRTIAEWVRASTQ